MIDVKELRKICQRGEDLSKGRRGERGDGETGMIVHVCKICAFVIYANENCKENCFTIVKRKMGRTLLLYSVCPINERRRCVGQHVMDYMAPLNHITTVVIVQAMYAKQYRIPATIQTVQVATNVCDFGNWGVALKTVDWNGYDCIVFLNDSVAGPFMPDWVTSYVQSDWTVAFHQIGSKYDLIGIADNWFPRYHVQSYCFAMSPIAVTTTLQTGLFAPCRNREEALQRELGLTTTIVTLMGASRVNVLVYRPKMHDNLTLQSMRVTAGLVSYNPLQFMWIKYDGVHYGLDAEAQSMVDQLICHRPSVAQFVLPFT